MYWLSKWFIFWLCDKAMYDMSQWYNFWFFNTFVYL